MEYKSHLECPCQLICAFLKDWKGGKISTVKKSFEVERQKKKKLEQTSFLVIIALEHLHLFM